MKKLICILMMLSILLCACGKKDAPQDTSPSKPPETTAPTEPPTTPPPTEPPVLYRNPLNGEPESAPWSGRPTAVVINNLKAALPQYGIAQADFFYELEVEGDITRCMAVYDKIGDVTGSIGPVRSVRTYFSNIALSYDAPIVHCGGSVRGRNGYSDISGSKIANWAHMDEMYNGSYFFRDQERRRQGYNYEHTLFTTGESLAKGLASRNISEPTDRSCDFSLQFDPDVSLNGAPAGSVTVYFRGGKQTAFTYDAASGLYKTRQYDQDWIDATTGETLSFRNLIVLYTSQQHRNDGEYSRSYYELEGSGEGLLAIGGKLVPINWSRDELRSIFVYTLTDGTPVTLGVGHTYVAVASTSSTPAEYK